MNIKQLVDKNENYLIETRRHLHRHPELSGEEYETEKFLKAEIEKYGLPIQQASNTGFIAILDTGKPGKTIGLRADIDALPIVETESNLKQKREVISENVGAMHACGHDAHMAMLLTTIKSLVEIKDQLKGKIIFIFEEGEERWTGINDMIETLRPLKLDAVFGMHVLSSLETGKVSIDEGPVMAGAIGAHITVKGKSGHVARPDLAVSPIFGGANILTNIASAWANQLDVTKTVTLGFTEFNSGDESNIIPNEAVISGSLRFYDLNEALKATQLIEKIAKNVGAAHNCVTSFTTENKTTAYPVDNDKNLAEIAQKAILKNTPDGLATDEKWFASESFSRYSELAPTAFAFIGIKNEEYGSGAEHHNEQFDIDEVGLKYGVLAEVQFVIDFLTHDKEK